MAAASASVLPPAPAQKSSTCSPGCGAASSRRRSGCPRPGSRSSPSGSAARLHRGATAIGAGGGCAGRAVSGGVEAAPSGSSAASTLSRVGLQRVDAQVERRPVGERLPSATPRRRRPPRSVATAIRARRPARSAVQRRAGAPSSAPRSCGRQRHRAQSARRSRAQATASSAPMALQQPCADERGPRRRPRPSASEPKPGGAARRRRGCATEARSLSRRSGATGPNP